MSVEDFVQRALTEHARDMSAVPDVAALVARGTQARRRRRLAIAAAVVATAVVSAIVVGPVLSDTAEPPPVVGTPTAPASSEATAPVEPRTGTAFFAGSANVPVRFTIPPGWEMLETLAVVKSGADPVVGVTFYDVANIYADGCRWELADPPVGAGVDDLVTAYENVEDLQATAARDITVDGFDGKQIQFTVPDYADDNCQDDTYALVQADNAGTDTGQPGPPNMWAQAPNQQTTASILDVDGTRLVVYTIQLAGSSAQDRMDLDTILDSIDIGP